MCMVQMCKWWVLPSDRLYGADKRYKGEAFLAKWSVGEWRIYVLTEKKICTYLISCHIE